MSEFEETNLPSSSELTRIEPHTFLFGFSGLMFRIGLALATFEQVRPFWGVQVSDYFFFVSLAAFLSKPISRLREIKGCGVPIAASLILTGAILSLRNVSSLGIAAGPLERLLVLFVLFAPLALVHSRNIWKNAEYLMFGIFANCCLAPLQEWVYPGIADALSINPTQPDISDTGRIQALTSHPNILGFSAGLALLIAVILLLSQAGRHMRGRLLLVVLVCSIAGLLTGSRTFIVAFAVGFLVFGFTSRHQQRKAIFGGVITLLLVWGSLEYLVPVILSQYSERLSSTGSSFAPDEGRYVAAGLALLEIYQKPILGWGPDHLDDAGMWLNPETGELAGVHNSFLMYWHGAGILAATGFLVLFIVDGRRMVLLSRQNLDRLSREPVQLALACWVLLFVVCNLHPILYNRFVFVPLFMFAGFTQRVWLRSKVYSTADKHAPREFPFTFGHPTENRA